jgi:VWFA-related protein
MRSRIAPFLLGSLAVAILVAPAVPQARQTTPAQGPVFRKATNLVEVEVMVRNRAGTFVRDLTAKDLELYEDGKRQTIEQCYLVARDRTSGRTGESTPASRTTLTAPRVFVFVFDELDLETSALIRIKQGAIDFLNTEFTEEDFGGVVVDGRLYESKLTRSRAVLIAAVRAVQPAFDSRESRLRPFRDFPRIPGEAEAARLALGDRMLVDELGRQACQEDPFQCNQLGGLQNVENKLQLKARAYVSQARDATRHTMGSIENAVAALAALPGRKTFVFFTDGFFSSEVTNELHQLAGRAARAGAAIYSIDGRGPAGGPPQGPDVTVATAPISGGLDTSEDGPFALADGTGAFVVRHASDISHALGVIALDTGTYYVVGYRPTNSVMDGKFRKVTVKAKEPGLTIRARKGYVASPLPPLIIK